MVRLGDLQCSRQSSALAVAMGLQRAPEAATTALDSLWAHDLPARRRRRAQDRHGGRPPRHGEDRRRSGRWQLELEQIWLTVSSLYPPRALTCERQRRVSSLRQPPLRPLVDGLHDRLLYPASSFRLLPERCESQLLEDARRASHTAGNLGLLRDMVHLSLLLKGGVCICTILLRMV